MDESTVSEICARCDRGQEACQYCEGMIREDWETCCDCGLYDFDEHLLPCDLRDPFRYVVVADHDAADTLRTP